MNCDQIGVSCMIEGVTALLHMDYAVVFKSLVFFKFTYEFSRSHARVTPMDVGTKQINL